ncbi:two pore domain potassium channel family protein [Nafulsella turpanensis]|uniref:two pore domain potassium channel family protein n=1 Tax=Nafulsella turpanensis TaxID=1265690 RepID=UPI000381F6E0|nr:two pore domain potassium channel family protein [Nafulsella turpanensis]
MNYVFLVAGIVIVCLAGVDVLVSTLAPRGTGFFSTRLRSVIWNFFHWCGQGRGESRMLNYAGMFTVAAWLFGWILMLWIGNFLIYLSAPDSVLYSGTNASAGPIDKLYFTGYVLSTMGNGDFKPGGGWWSVYSAVISFSGFVTITLAITYLVPVLSAEMEKRKTSIYIHSLGASPEEILINAWNGKDFSRLTQHFGSLTDSIMSQAQKHVAYPVLHNFHSHLHQEALAINLVTLDEALSILLLYGHNETYTIEQQIYPLRFAISDYLATLANAFIEPSNNEPGPFRMERLRQSAIPFKQENEDIRMDKERLRLRRKLLLGMLENDGWHWGNIYMTATYESYDISRNKEVASKGKIKHYNS